MMNKFLFISALCVSLLTGCISSTQIVVGKDADGNEIVREMDDFDVEKASKARTKLAVRFIQLKQMAEAKQNLELAESYMSGTEELYLAWGLYYATVGDNVNAKRVYEEGLNKYGSGAINTAYGSYLCSLHDYKQADEKFNNALLDAKYANISNTYAKAAVCAYESGDKTKAKEYFAKAMNYGGTSPSLLFNYATFSYELGEYAKADKLMRTFEMFEKTDTPQTLWLKIKIANKIGQLQTRKIYGDKLLRIFPNSDEATMYQAEQF